MVTIAFHPSSLARSHSYLLLTDSCSLVNIRAWSFSRQSHSRLWKSNRWIYSQIVWWDGSTRTDVFCRGDCWKFTGTIGEYNIPWIITTYVFPISFFFFPKEVLTYNPHRNFKVAIIWPNAKAPCSFWWEFRIFETKLFRRRLRWDCERTWSNR